MKHILSVIAVVLLSTQAMGMCVDAQASAADKKALGAAIKVAIGATASWTEVKKGTNVLETRKTITMTVNHTDPFKSKFASGTLKASLLKICATETAVIITTTLGNVKLKKSGEHLQVKTFVGTYYILPTHQVIQQKAEMLNTPDEEYNEHQTTVTT